MNLVTFKEDQRFWTLYETKKDREKEDNHDVSPVCTNTACSNACFGVMSSFLDVTNHSLSMPMPLSDITKPRTDIHTNKLSTTTFRDQYHCGTLKPVINNIDKQERRATLKKR